MSAWQFQGTVSYQSGNKVAYASVSLARAGGRSPVTLVRTVTDLSGRFEATLRDGFPSGQILARAYDGWNQKSGEWISVTPDCDSCNLVLPWEGPQIAKIDRLDFFQSEPFIRALIFALENPLSGRIVYTVRREPLREDGGVQFHYPGDPAVERMFLQFQEEAASEARTSHAAIDMARRITDCLLRMGQGAPHPERAGVIRAALYGMIGKTPSERMTHARTMLKALSAASRRPFVPGNGALVDFEAGSACIALVLFALALMSLGRSDLRISRLSGGAGRTLFQLDVPRVES